MEDTKMCFAVTSDFKTLSYGEVELRELKENEVLVKVESAPINEVDSYVALGVFPHRIQPTPSPLGIGFEGSGVITEVHESVSSDLIGKKVVFNQNPMSEFEYQGAWRQYLILDKSEILTLSDDVDFDKVCGSFVNPITICAIVDTVIKGSHKAFINDAACSSLGKMLIKFCKKLSIPLINIVRREEQVKILRELGADSETFKEDLTLMANELNATAYFDCIGGNIIGKVLDCMPNKSIAHIYGYLSHESLEYNLLNFVMKNQTITSFGLRSWKENITNEEYKKWEGYVVEDLSNGAHIFGQV